jgi:hypothetical protein
VQTRVAIWEPIFMWRFASVSLLLLSGCSYNTWWNAPFTTGYNPNRPDVVSENIRRALGQQVAPPPLRQEAGDIWPGRMKAEPTLQELEQSGSLTPEPEQPTLGSPLSRGTAPGQPPSLPPQGTAGSSTPPPSNQAGVVQPPRVRPPHTPAAPAPIAPPAGGQIVNTPTGTCVTTGGGAGYQTMTLPGGGTAIVVPNGNGTSTVIKPDGTIQTIPTPK